MSVFDNHLENSTLNKESDNLILANYRISNSGATLIPKKGTFALTKKERRSVRISKTSKIPVGTFKEEHSIFRSMYGKLCEEGSAYTYHIFEEVIRGMNLPCLVYNAKRYYQVNRDVKRKIWMAVCSRDDRVSNLTR